MTPGDLQYLLNGVRRRLDLINTQVVLGRNSAGVGPFEEITYADLASYLTVAGGLGAGTVISVGLALPSPFSVSGTPVTSSGTLTGTFAVQAANTFLAGPVSGASAAPAMRALDVADLPAGIWTSSNDGAASGLDADLLDGQQGAHYLARANHTGTQAWGTLTGTPTTLVGYGITDAASDAELAAHAALTSGVHGISAFGATLVDDASASAARTTLGLGTAATHAVPASGDAAIGEVVKGSDTRLTNARTPSAHTHPSSEISDSTAAGRAILTGADAAAQRTSLGLGTAALVNVPASGNAASGEAVKGDDTRLTNARTPSAHTHVISDTTGLQAALDAKLATAGGTVTGSLALTGIGADVASVDAWRLLVRDPGTNEVRPMTAAFARGHLDAAAAYHYHLVGDVTGLQAQLDGKSATGHTHVISNVTGLQAALDNRAMLTHGHAIGDVAGLQIALDGKVPTSRLVSTASSLSGGGDLSANLTLSLDGDSDTPGNSKYYGTDWAGAKGFHSFPGGITEAPVDGSAYARKGGAWAVLAWGDVTGKPVTFTPTSHTHDWTSDITGKPSTFPPSTHSHAISDVTGLQTALDAKLALAGGTVTGALALSGIGADVASAGGWRLIVRDPADNTLRPMTAAFARGHIDAAAASHTHPSTDITDSTAAGRAILSGATAAAQRTTLGLGGAALLNVGTGSGDVAAGNAVATHSALTTGVHGFSGLGAQIVGAADASTVRGYLSLGTAALLDVPVSGDAAIGDVVKGNDTRLTNARTPTAHTHSASEISDSTAAGRAMLTAADDIDQLTILGLFGVGAPTIDAPAKYAVRVNGVGTVSTRHRLNLIAGSGVSLSITDDSAGDEAEVTVTSTASGSGHVQPVTKQTATYTATSADGIILCAFNSPLQKVTLPTSGLTNGQVITVTRVGGSASVYIYHGATLAEEMSVTGDSRTYVWYAADSAFYLINSIPLS